MDNSNKSVIGLFPGQGSQAVSMGLEFAKVSEQAKELFSLADKTLGYELSKLCTEGPMEELTKTQNAQPALLTVSTIAYRESGIQLAAGAGHSLGEYSAYVAADAISFEDAVSLVNKRGIYMQESVPAGLGKMAAVMGAELESIQETADGISEGVVEIANINSPGQIVVAGESANR